MITEKQRGQVFTLVGPGGAGKNALMRIVLKRLDHLQQLATATTRPMRDDEQQGREHLFINLQQFKQMITNDKLLEWQEVTPDRFYGIPRASVDNTIAKGTDLIADIDVEGAKVLKKTYPDHAILIFITTPGETLGEQLEILKKRMTGRNSEMDPDLLKRRLDRAREMELPFATHCDHIIVNDEIEKAADQLYNIIKLERQRHAAPEETKQ